LWLDPEIKPMHTPPPGLASDVRGVRARLVGKDGAPPRPTDAKNAVRSPLIYRPEKLSLQFDMFQIYQYVVEDSNLARFFSILRASRG